jgi:hypothetical protein
VPSDAELREATGRRARYFARGVYSRGGVCCLTNTGPLAGALKMDEVHPTPASPWLVQPFLDGETVCTYSTAHQGRVSSHLMCRVPRQHKHSTGIQFQAIDATESLKLIEPIVAELGYTGQISFGFLVTDDGLTFVECNPRATDGLLLMPREGLAAGLLAPRPETFVLGAQRARYSSPSPCWPTASPINWIGYPSPSTTSRRSATRAAAGTTRCPRCTRRWLSATPSARASAGTWATWSLSPGHELGRRAHRRNVKRRRDAAHRSAPQPGEA